MQKKRIKRNIVIIGLILAIILNCTSCTTAKGGCTKLVNNLQTACNEKSLVKILNCINPDKEKMLPIKLLAMGVQDGSTEVISFVLNYLKIPVQDAQDSSDWIAIRLKTTDIPLFSRSGSIVCEVTIYVDGEPMKQDVYFNVIKKNRAWFIDGVGI